jgi:hypothetical protein
LPRQISRCEALRVLDSGGGVQAQTPLHHRIPMGQQFNKVIKRKRRVAYLKRKKAAIKAARTKK